MTRLIKRYGSRKLYDTQESRYILLEDIAECIRNGEDVSVVDNKSGEDVTALTLTQVISEESRKTSSFLPNDFLHDVIRAGETSVKRLQLGMESLVQKGFEKLVPVSNAREEMGNLRQRLDELEIAVNQAESEAFSAQAPKTEKAKVADKPKKVKAKKAPATETKKTPAPKAAAKKTKKTPARKTGTPSAPKAEKK